MPHDEVLQSKISRTQNLKTYVRVTCNIDTEMGNF